jgi:hypothetical protein
MNNVSHQLGLVQMYTAQLDDPLALQSSLFVTAIEQDADTDDTYYHRNDKHRSGTRGFRHRSGETPSKRECV